MLRSRLYALPFLFYRACIAPLFGVKTCRFYPTCSEYSHQAFVKHGFLKGGYYTLRRILRCHPWGGSGEDPVP